MHSFVSVPGCAILCAAVVTCAGTLIDYDTIALLMPSETRMALSRPAWMALQQLKTSATDGAGYTCAAPEKQRTRDRELQKPQNCGEGVMMGKLHMFCEKQDKQNFILGVCQGYEVHNLRDFF
eukprot:3428563-Amphidinium_carterae.1